MFLNILTVDKAPDKIFTSPDSQNEEDVGIKLI